MTEMTEKFLKNDKEKPGFELLPLELLSEVNDVLRFGAKKYGSPLNWKKKEGFKYSRAYNALLRHMLAWRNGEDNDPETGLSHLSHAMCNLIFLMYHAKNNKGPSDDRPKGAK